MIDAICKELGYHQKTFKGQQIQTLYFGGGTPSLLTVQEFTQIFTAIKSNYDLTICDEITLEINPEDVTDENIQTWKNQGFNRYSIGIQSFFGDDLNQMNRAHSSEQAHLAIQTIKGAGVQNYSVDFMFALPLLSDEQLLQNLQIAIEYEAPHISCYNLTVEEQTALLKLINKGKIENLSEEKSIRQFQLVMKTLAEAKYHQYEISNYAKEGFQSKHNSAYWQQKPYIGIGPSASSFYNNQRTQNIANNTKYITLINEGKDYKEIEELTDSDFYNEYLLTRLRTSKGININELELLFPQQAENFKRDTAQFLRGGELAFFGEEYRLTTQGKLMADHVASELFWV